MSFYVDEYGRRIDARPDLSMPRIRKREWYGIRKCGEIHGSDPCAACDLALKRRLGAQQARHRARPRAAR